MVVLGLDTDFAGGASQLSRDSVMAMRLQRYLTAPGLQQEKFYGLFGYYHVLQEGIGPENTYPFAAKLKRLGTGDKVSSIVCLPLESQMYLPPGSGYPDVPDQQLGWFNADGPFFLVKGIKDARAASEPGSLSLFRLNDVHTPYGQGNRLAGARARLFGDDVLPFDESKPTTALFQYLVLMRGSAAIRKL